jgi:hypothetical protein
LKLNKKSSTQGKRPCSKGGIEEKREAWLESKRSSKQRELKIYESYGKLISVKYCIFNPP